MRYLVTYHKHEFEQDFHSFDSLVEYVIETLEDNGYFISHELDSDIIIKLYKHEFSCSITPYREKEK